MRVLVIGGGNMGLTYAEAMTKSKLLRKRNIMILDNAEHKVKSLGKMSNFDAFLKPEDCVPKAHIIFIAVKPYHSEELLANMRPLLTEGQIIISIMAGVSIEKMQKSLDIKKVVRAMPNLPAQIGKGMTSFTASPEVSKVELLMVENLIDTTGRSIYVDSEKYLDASTGISGSGPAYVFYFMKSMMDAALDMGFTENDAKFLVSQTFEGAVQLFNASNLTPDDWMNKVASKGGTTRAALDSMDDNKLSDKIKEAAHAAFSRAVELGNQY